MKIKDIKNGFKVFKTVRKCLKKNPKITIFTLSISENELYIVKRLSSLFNYKYVKKDNLNVLIYR